MKASCLLFSRAARETAILTQRTKGQFGASHTVSPKKLWKAVTAVED